MIALPARVGVVTTSYPRWAGDAAGGFVAAHAHALVAAGARVEVIAADAPGAARIDGAMPITRVSAPPGLFYAGGAPDALEAGAGRRGAAGFSLRLAAACGARRTHVDATVAHWLAPSALAALTSRGPLLAVAHGGDVHLLARTGLLPATIATLAARRARIAFVSRALRELTDAALPSPLRRWLVDASEVIPMGEALDHFAAQPRAAPAPGEVPRLVVLARLVPIKGVDVIIAALAHVPMAVELVIAGDGPLRGDLARAAAASPHGHRIRLVGQLDAPARDALLASATALVIPSRALASGRSEGLPQAALEALAAGVPVIATRSGGLADLPPPVQLVTADDPRALAQAIDDQLRRPAPRADLQRVAASYQWPQIEQRLRRLWLGPTTT